MKRFNPADIESKWQAKWDADGVYRADLESDKPKYIAMSMFNYPSGAGIHIGHAMNYTISDVMARYKRQAGYESYHPVGWDAFGLPAENYAIKAGVSPQESMATIIPGYHTQYKAMGWSNDWTKEVATHQPIYYKWTQWIFAQMYKNGLAYQDARQQWWCEKCQTVLANEQVIDNKCWRHDAVDDQEVHKKEVKQWFFRITDYADELLEATDALDWTESVKLAQKNWIGRSVGAEVRFSVAKQTEVRSTEYGVRESAVSYIMGQKNITSADIEALGGTIEKITPAGHLCVVFPRHKTDEFEKLITEKMQPGFWNEYMFDEGVVFIFKFTDGTTKRFELNDTTNDEIHRLGCEFNGEICPGGKALDWLKDNEWYSHTSYSILHTPDSDFVAVFTTRPDTLFGATFLVLAPEHELVDSLTTEDKWEQMQTYKTEAAKKSELQRQENKEKTGVFTGSYATNPINGEKLPVWVADYVLTGYGTGAIMAVPAHDERDHEFAKKFDLPIKQVVKHDEGDEIYTGDGILMNSGQFDGVPSAEARELIVQHLKRVGKATEKTNYKIRDWSVSRQRYWGAPIPIVHCDKDGIVLVPDDQLPVTLPELDDFKPSGDGRSALARANEWLKTTCPTCGGPAERETDTLDTYICSSWYILRYFDPRNETQPFAPEMANKWMPIDFYNGGDHATAHMIYARFVTRFFHKLGLVENPEPFKRFLFNGKVMASDGSAFSKSKGNGIDPLEIINQGYGADALRTYLMFAAPLEFSMRWDPNGVPGTYRWLSRVWNLVQEFTQQSQETRGMSQEKNLAVLRIIHPVIKKVTEQLEDQRYNTAIAAMMKATNELYEQKKNGFQNETDWQFALESLVSLMAPFAPHTAEELWHDLGRSSYVQRESWPTWSEEYLQGDTITLAVQVNGKVRSEIQVAADADNETVRAVALADEKIKGYVADTKPKRVIVVPGRLVNIVIG